MRSRKCVVALLAIRLSRVAANPRAVIRQAERCGMVTTPRSARLRATRSLISFNTRRKSKKARQAAATKTWARPAALASRHPSATRRDERRAISARTPCRTRLSNEQFPVAEGGRGPFAENPLARAATPWHGGWRDSYLQ